MSQNKSYKSEEVANAVSHIWNNKIKDADAILEKQNTTDPRYALHYAEV